jgi:hypothetical protein
MGEVIEIVGSQVKVFKQQGKQRELVSTVPLTKWLGQIYASKKITTPLLPNGTRFYLTDNQLEIVVVEDPPKLRTIQILREGFEDEDDDQDEQDGEGLKSYHLAFPYIIYIYGNCHCSECSEYGENYPEFYLFYRRLPIKSLTDQICKANLPNIEHDGKVCLGTSDILDEISEKKTLKDRVERIIQFFWESDFNDELGGLEHPSDDPRLASFKNWALASQKNPLFPLKVNWPNGDLTISRVVSSIKDEFIHDNDDRKIKDFPDLVDLIFRLEEE